MIEEPLSVRFVVDVQNGMTRVAFGVLKCLLYKPILPSNAYCLRFFNFYVLNRVNILESFKLLIWILTRFFHGTLLKTNAQQISNVEIFEHNYFFKIGHS
jgi:hypothetical protein